jgi:hypothetical protein
MLVAMPALAEDVAFEGHTLEVDGSREARPILRMTGTKYSIPGSPAQIVGKAERCATSQPDAIRVESVLAENGQLLAATRADYRQRGRRSVQAKLAFAAGEGNFRVVFTELATSPADAISYAPLIQQDGAGWESALEAVIDVEQALLDCMFR